MNFLRLYLAEITGLVLVLLTLLVATTVATRYFPDRRVALKAIRNLGIAATLAGAAFSFMMSLALNQPPRGQIDRTAVDQDQKAFEQRHSNQGR